MDLSPNVSRSLRAVDGAIVVVDAVEEIQVQTEAVMRMALQELVKPVLFINKIDRLINELKLSLNEIQNKLEKIIQDFNSLIEIYCPEEFKGDWKINPLKGNVGFGSAIYPNWGFTYNILKNKDINFNSIFNLYKEKKVLELNRLIPLYDTIFTLFVDHLPNPLNAQLYRLKAIKTLELTSEMNQAIKNCDENGPIIINIFNSIQDDYLNKFSIGRIYSGKIKNNSTVFDVNLQEEFKIRKLCLFMGAKKIPVDEIPAGNILAIGGIKKIKIGHTLTNYESKDNISKLKEIKYYSDPVITVSFEPKRPQQLNEMIDYLLQIQDNDPNIDLTINKESGQFLVAGMGMLHLELIGKKLFKRGIEIIMSDPMIIYREMIQEESPKFESYFDETNKLVLKLGAYEEIEYSNIEYSDNQNNVILNLSNKSIPIKIKEYLLKGFKIGLKSGPLCDEPIMNLKIEIIDLAIDYKTLELEEKFMLLAKRTLFGAFLLSKPQLYQPIYKIEIETSEENIGNVSNILSKNNARVENIVSQGIFSKLTGFISVKKSIKFSQNLRNLTSGKSIWQMMFSHWEKIAEKKQDILISEIRLKKGRRLEVPDPLSFGKKCN